MDATIKVDYDSKTYAIDLEAVTLKQAMAVQSYLGQSIFSVFDQFTDLKEDTPELFKALGAVYWLMKNQAGEQFPIADTDFALFPFLTAFMKSMAGDAAEGEPGPTQPPPPASASLNGSTTVSPSPPAAPSPTPSAPGVIPQPTA